MGNIMFDPSTVPADDSGDFAPVPAGWYAVVIDEAEVAPSKSEAAGNMLKLKLIVNPRRHPDTGERRLWDNLCYQHQNETPRKIAQRHLAAICRAIGIDGQLEDTEQLLGKQLAAKVKLVPGTSSEDPGRNEIVAYKALSEHAEDEKKPASKPAAAKPAAATGAKPKPSWA